jgi:hypothetical protein
MTDSRRCSVARSRHGRLRVGGASPGIRTDRAAVRDGEGDDEQGANETAASDEDGHEREDGKRRTGTNETTGSDVSVMPSSMPMATDAGRCQRGIGRVVVGRPDGRRPRYSSDSAALGG